MRSVLILLSVFAVFGTHAQSKKKINAQLLIELAVVQRTADSIEIIRLDRQREIKNIRYALDELSGQMERRAYDEAGYRADIRRKHNALTQLGFDANTITSLTELDTLPSPMKDKQFGDQSIWNNRPFVVIQRPEMRDITDLKIKVQNEILQTKIAEYKNVNDQNKALLAEDQIFLSDMKSLRTDYTVSLEVYKIFNKDLAAKVQSLSVKQRELDRIRLEEELLKKQKAIEAANKAKSKKSKDYDPPIIVDREIDDYYWDRRDTDIYGKDSGIDPYDFAVPPPPAPEKVPAPEILEIVEQQAEFPGGIQAMKTFLAANLKMPAVAEELGINGKVYLRFVVSEKGNISNVSVKKGIADCKECDDEAVRVVKSMPNWTPAMNNGKPVNCWFTLPVLFKVQ